jgi:hypothetical protein
MGMGDKPLTWQQVVIVLLCLPLLAGIPMMFVPERGAREIGMVILLFDVPLIAFMYWWHRTVHNRPDVEPDVLAQVCNPKGLLHVGDAHLYVGGGLTGDSLLLTVLAQNLFDAENDVDVALRVDKGSQFLGGSVPTLTLRLPPSAVAGARLAVPVRRGKKRGEVKLAILAASKARGGNKVRFARRTALSKKVNPGLTVALAVTGTFYGGGGTFLTVQIPPGAPEELADLRGVGGAAPAGLRWEGDAVWVPGDPLEAVPERVQRLLLPPSLAA